MQRYITHCMHIQYMWHLVIAKPGTLVQKFLPFIKCVMELISLMNFELGSHLVIRAIKGMVGNGCDEVTSIYFAVFIQNLINMFIWQCWYSSSDDGHNDDGLIQMKVVVAVFISGDGDRWLGDVMSAIALLLTALSTSII